MVKNDSETNYSISAKVTPACKSHPVLRYGSAFVGLYDGGNPTTNKDMFLVAVVRCNASL